MRALLALSVLAGCCPQPAAPRPAPGGAEIWLAVGQSNMVGHGALDPATDEQPRADVTVFGDYVWREASEPMSGPITDTLWDARYQGDRGEHSLLLRFGKHRAEDCGCPVGIVPAAVGGTAIVFWDPTVTQTRRVPDAMTLSERAVKLTQAAGPITGILWWQGESDAVAGTDPDTYRVRLAHVVAGFRQELGAVPVVLAQLGGTDDLDDHWLAIQAAQAEAAETLPNTALVVTDDLSRVGVHLTTAGLKEAGDRFAVAAQLLETP